MKRFSSAGMTSTDEGRPTLAILTALAAALDELLSELDEVVLGKQWVSISECNESSWGAHTMMAVRCDFEVIRRWTKAMPHIWSGLAEDDLNHAPLRRRRSERLQENQAQRSCGPAPRPHTRKEAVFVSGRARIRRKCWASMAEKPSNIPKRFHSTTQSLPVRTVRYSTLQVAKESTLARSCIEKSRCPRL